MTESGFERAIEIYVAVQLAIIGVSHVVQSAVWVRLFKQLAALEHVGVFATGFGNLIFGSLIVAFHDVWSGWAVIVTVLGWANVVKAALAFAIPDLGLRVLARVSAEHAWEIQLGGIVFLLIATWLAARLWFNVPAL